MSTFSNLDSAAIPNQGAHKATGEDPIITSGVCLTFAIHENQPYWLSL